MIPRLAHLLVNGAPLVPLPPAALDPDLVIPPWPRKAVEHAERRPVLSIETGWRLVAHGMGRAASVGAMR